MDQVVWLRYLTLIFGNTTHAAATLLAVFLGGLGLGAHLGGRFGARIQRPLRIYALVEIGIALLALLSPRLFELIGTGYVALYQRGGTATALFTAGRVVLAALCLLPPTMLMGATLPLMLRAAAPAGRRLARATAILYAANTLGAVFGAGLAGFVTIRALGLYATLCLAAGFNLAVALACALASRPIRLPAPAAAVTVAPRSWVLLVCCFMGASSLAYEVLWTRILVFHLGSSVYAFSLLLVLFLLGVGAGSLLAAPWADRLSPFAVLALLEAGIAACTLAQLWQFQHLDGSLVALLGMLPPGGFAGVTFVELLALLPILLPPTLIMGLSFPFAVRALSRDPRGAAADVGATYAANTAGSVVGSIAAGFLLIPWLGTQNALLAVGAANALLAGILWLVRPGGSAERRGWRWAALGAPLPLLAAMILTPPDRVILSAGTFRDDRPRDLVYFAEDASASVTVRRARSISGPYLSLELNGINVAGTSPELFAVQKMQGHLPLLLAAEARRVLHIGFGSGGTAHAVSLHPVEQLKIVEISPAVLRTSDRYFAHLNHGVLRDPRVEVEVNDGRNFLLASPERFDAILSDSIHPRYAGNGSLYSSEYFRLLRARLRPGGVASMWLPMYSMQPRDFAMVLRAFADAFPHVAVWYEPSSLNAFTIVTGTLDRPAWSAETLARAFADQRIAAELAELGIRGPAEILACYLEGGESLRRWLLRVPPHVDDVPTVEYESGTSFDRDWTWLENFEELLFRRPASPPEAFLAPLPPPERERARRLFAERRVVLARHRAVLESRLLPEAEAAAAHPGPDR